MRNVFGLRLTKSLLLSERGELQVLGFCQNGKSRPAREEKECSAFRPHELGESAYYFYAYSRRDAKARIGVLRPISTNGILDLPIASKYRAEGILI